MQEFSEILERDFFQWAAKNEQQPTAKNLIEYLIKRKIINKNVPAYFMVLHEYPEELYKLNAKRYNAVKTLADKYDVSEQKIYQLLHNQNRFKI